MIVLAIAALSSAAPAAAMPRPAALAQAASQVVEAQQLLAAGNAISALQSAQAAVATRERLLGPYHPDTLLDQRLVGRILLALSRPAEASSLLLATVDATERVFGPEHPVTAEALVELANALRAGNQPDQAEPVLRRALLIFSRARGRGESEHVARLALADILGRSGRLAEAEVLLRVALIRANNSSDVSEINQVRQALAHVLTRMNRVTEAEIWLACENTLAICFSEGRQQ